MSRLCCARGLSPLTLCNLFLQLASKGERNLAQYADLVGKRSGQSTFTTCSLPSKVTLVKDNFPLGSTNTPSAPLTITSLTDSSDNMNQKSHNHDKGKHLLIGCDLIQLNTNDCGSFDQFPAGLIQILLVFRMDNTILKRGADLSEILSTRLREYHHRRTSKYLILKDSVHRLDIISIISRSPTTAA